MKSIVAVAGVMAALFVTEAHAASGFSGNNMLGACREASELKSTAPAAVCLGIAHAVAVIREDEKAYCPPKGFLGGQGVKILYAYMLKHPEQLHLDLVDLATRALVDAFPCKPTS
jgi:hypothetical protein